MLEIPASIEDVTPAWLDKALSTTTPGLEIDSAQVVDVVHGACTKVRIGVRANRNDFPSTVMMKIGFEPHSEAMMLMHRREHHAYHDLAPTLEVNTPRCFYSAVDDAGRALVILEDLCLRDVRFQSLQAPLSFDVASRFLEGLARIHARWWGEPGLEERFPWTRNAQVGDDHYLDILRSTERFNRYVFSPRGAATPRRLLDGPLLLRAYAAMQAYFRDLPDTVGHGDMHLGNLYTDADGTPGYLDWQPYVGPWSIDVSYFMIAGLDVLDRRRWEGALLQHYLTCLAGLGVKAPTFDDAWAAYRRSVIWGLAVWMLNSSQFQTESNNTAAATRFAMATVDLDTLGLLGLGSC